LPEFFTDLELSFATDAGHFVHYETPERAADEIDQFFDRIATVANARELSDG
jgi:epoxide hydrolase 4